MGKERRAFQGVFMPRCIWLNNELKPSEKMLLTEINSLDTQKECFASNDHFTTFLNVSKGRVSQMISHLKDLKYINVKLIYKPHSKEIDKRVITVNQQKFYGITHLGNEHTPLADYLPPLGNAQDNISINKSMLLSGMPFINSKQSPCCKFIILIILSLSSLSTYLF